MIRDRPDWVRERLQARGAGDDAKVDRVLELDARRRDVLTKVERLKAERNRLSKEIGFRMAERRVDEAERLKEQTRELGREIAALEKELKDSESDSAIERARRTLLLELPNLPHESVPTGSTPEENVVVRSWGTKAGFGFAPRTHIELCESLGLVDFARGAKLSGSGFLLYTGWGARLERALIQFLLDLHTGEHGYTEVSPPYIINRDCMEGVGQLPKFADQAYAVVEGEDQSSLGRLYLLPTAEAPVANIHRDELLRQDDLPIRYCAYSPCFRAEAGAAGVSTRGMIRVHQFDKVELIQIVGPEAGYDALEELVGHAERVLQLLGLHYRVVALCAGDLGFASAKTYDIEVWAPGQGTYLEVSSCSNCEEYQARRMNLRFKTRSGQNVFPHVLNGSGTALARLFVALLETHQGPDGGVRVPEPLRPYLNADRIGPTSG
jgi:seryl-tRNA synthetase